MDKNVRGLRLHLKRKAQKQKVIQAMDKCIKRLDHMLSPEGRQEVAEREILLRKRRAFDIKGYVKSIYGRR
jgi:hypothetical protein